MSKLSPRARRGRGGRVVTIRAISSLDQFQAHSIWEMSVKPDPQTKRMALAKPGIPKFRDRGGRLACCEEKLVVKAVVVSRPYFAAARPSTFCGGDCGPIFNY